ncbi:hypothetical protein RBSH_04532 [Rhodopirellula baltica SH28]|uniref:Uncharacterized protein n=1 Tax=Rhodopirellula baltica SH28 TaxID=993517 RepID=K5E331_RHOBT|nr:hypothetical protein RBSH_04532 [Rhodopirellula baltica SH28]
MNKALIHGVFRTTLFSYVVPFPTSFPSGSALTLSSNCLSRCFVFDFQVIR